MAENGSSDGQGKDKTNCAPLTPYSLAVTSQYLNIEVDLLEHSLRGFTEIVITKNELQLPESLSKDQHQQISDEATFHIETKENKTPEDSEEIKKTKSKEDRTAPIPEFHLHTRQYVYN
mmetsp:Transcript_3514/g.4411  ORF Transcript_3514/g.4411 Transcript_3514/m.4411 type:complete len:119 (-) Transcript_3514:85-441(-)